MDGHRSMTFSALFALRSKRHPRSVSHFRKVAYSILSSFAYASGSISARPILPNSYWALSQAERPRSKARLNLSANRFSSASLATRAASARRASWALRTSVKRSAASSALRCLAALRSASALRRSPGKTNSLYLPFQRPDETGRRHANSIARDANCGSWHGPSGWSEPASSSRGRVPLLPPRFRCV